MIEVNPINIVGEIIAQALVEGISLDTVVSDCALANAWQETS